MKVLNKMPEDGKFVIVWEYEGEIQSGTYQREGDMLMDLNEDDSDMDYSIYAMSSVFHQDSTIYIVLS